MGPEPTRSQQSIGMGRGRGGDRSLMGKRDESYQNGGALPPLDFENQKDINIRKHENNTNKHLGVENSPRLPDKNSSIIANAAGEKK